jgi:hypothetical protein
MLLTEGRPVPLRGGMGLRISTLMGAKRIELKRLGIPVLDHREGGA